MEGTAGGSEIACTLVDQAFNVLESGPGDAVGRGWAIMLGRGHAVHGCVGRCDESADGGSVFGGDDVCRCAGLERHLVPQLRPVVERNGIEDEV